MKIKIKIVDGSAKTSLAKRRETDQGEDNKNNLPGETKGNGQREG